LDICKAGRIVFKVGTSTLTHPSGLINLRRIERLVKVLADLKNMGKEIVLVTSGAIGVGVGKLGLAERPKDIRSKQAIAAIGQVELMYIYDRLFSEYNHTISQVLLTRDIVEEENRCALCRNTFSRLLEYKVIPIVNENDTVAVEEIEFGDNDSLSAVVATLCGADLLVILSDIDGLYNDNPRKNPDAVRIPEVHVLDETILEYAKGAGSARGTGGMITKLHAAQLAGDAGIDTVVMNGEDPAQIYDLLEGKPVGTRFFAHPAQA
jgi:glutamate 5-kinase